ncbi:hypothetical protein [Mastigocladopsis repens]|uniref:hypothetical protein n=1 Tax=Mastigocladopsis repens TaxID=221287 RepID=UPI0002D7E4D5|nr:hypothetical protein [Mastigocladopsis repens]
MTDEENRTISTDGGNYNEHIEGNYIQGDFYAAPSDFFKPNLKQFESVDTSPTVTPELLEVVKKQRLLVLGTSVGGATINVHNLALYLAYRLTKELDEQGYNSENGNISVKQWRRNSEPDSIDTVFQEDLKQTTIFVLTEASLENVGYNLSRIQEYASEQHYVIASTDKPWKIWKLPSMPEYWRELSVDGLYKLSDLEKILSREIEKLREEGTLPPQLHKGELELNKTVVDDWSLRKIAQSLKTPDNITRFLQFLCAEKQPLQAEVIEKLIQLTQGQENTLKQWYDHILKPREQLLALGLSFFDGLPENQIFAALDILVEQAWRVRDPSLSHFDRSDLNNLFNFFKVIKDDEKGDLARITSVLPQQRRWLFKWAWDSHRQQLRAALPVIAKIIKNSVAKRDNDLELYGDSIQRRQLRITISESLSEIGCISYSGIEKTLLQLAADQNIGVQNVAAFAMARWREPDYDKSDEELIETLQRWLDPRSTNPLIRQLNDIMEDDGKKAKGLKPEDYLSSTVALSVGYASLYDQPQNSRNSSDSVGLSQEFYELLKTLSRQTGFLVRSRFLNETLRRVVRLHLFQLHDWLHDLIQQNTNEIELQNAVGTSLASAYRVNPQLVIKLLDYWHKECTRYRSALVDKEIVTPYEALLATIARTYGKIKCDQHLTQQEIIKHLCSILVEEKHPFVRAAILEAMKKQGNEHEAERIIEEELHNFEQEIQKERIYNTDDIAPKRIPTSIPTHSTLEDLYISQIVPWLAIALRGVYYIVFKRNYYKKLLGETFYYKQVISGILPEALEHNFSNLSAKSFVLDRFQNEKSEKTKIISDLLKLSLWLARNPRSVVIGIVILVGAYNFLKLLLA